MDKWKTLDELAAVPVDQIPEALNRLGATLATLAARWAVESRPRPRSGGRPLSAARRRLKAAGQSRRIRP